MSDAASKTITWIWRFMAPAPVVKLPASPGLPRQLTQIYEDSAVKIVTDDRLTQDQAQMAAKIFEAARMTAEVLINGVLTVKSATQ